MYSIRKGDAADSSGYFISHKSRKRSRCNNSSKYNSSIIELKELWKVPVQWKAWERPRAPRYRNHTTSYVAGESVMKSCSGDFLTWE
jgi:hypothetical protein